MSKKQRNQDRSFGLKSTANRNQLLGKVVLIIGNDTAVLQTFITQLAQKGADIALFCQQLSKETMQHLKARVESLGQRFLFIEDSTQYPLHPNHLVQIVVTDLGNLDVFIDLSAQNTSLNNFKPAGHRHLNWQYAHAVLKEFAR